MTIPYPYELFVVGIAHIGYGVITDWAVNSAGQVTGNNVLIPEAQGEDSDND